LPATLKGETMFFYLTPVTSQTITIGSRQQTILAPKYCSTDMAGLPYSCVPYGAEGWCVVALTAENSALAAETDVYAFPSDLSTVMQDSDVSTLAAFLATANVPSDQIVSGMTFEAALTAILTIFLVAQAIAGSTGSAIFTDGTTVDTPISDTSASALVPSTSQASVGVGMGFGAIGGGGNAGNASNPQSSQVGPFDFSDVSSSDAVGDVLNTVSQQFTSPIVIGSATLGA
jgi:hypothetical protein